jgi:hypothetical protein
MNNIEQFFKDSLDNKMAYISSGGLTVEGTSSQKCKLNFIMYTGLQCLVKIDNNNNKIVKEVEQILIQDRDSLGITYDKRDEIINSIIPKLKEMFVQSCIISYYGIKEISSVYEKENIKNIEIKYTNGSIVKISNIEKIQ